MGNQRNIIFILLIIAVVAFSIELTRTDFIIKLNKKSNTELIDRTRYKTNRKEVNEAEYLIIYDSTDNNINTTLYNIENTLKILKFKFKTVPMENMEKFNGEFGKIIVVSEKLKSLKFSKDLMNYVFNGGDVFFAYRLGGRNGLNYIYRDLGIKEYGEFLNVTGVNLKENLLLNSKGKRIEEEIYTYNSSYSMTLDDTTEMIMESINGTPLLWKKNHGEGKIVYFNGTMLYRKNNRGVISGALSYLDEYIIYPIINSKVMYIDGFPGPFPLGDDKKIKEDFNRSVPVFYKEVWWPDMLKLSSKYNLKYTGTVIGTYKDNVEKINKDDIDLIVKEFVYYGKEIIRNMGEMGINGFNHQPFILENSDLKELGYKQWLSAFEIQNSIKLIKSFANEIFQDYEFRVYVPPSNVISASGRKILSDSELGIEIIASSYNDDNGQEFTIGDDGIVEAPRLTSGFNIKPEDRWVSINGITTHGVLSHSIRAYEPLDLDKSAELGWTEMLKNFTDYNEYLFEEYQWINSHTATEGANAIIRYHVLDPIFEKKEDYLRIDYGTELNYYYLRTEKKIESVKNCKATKIDDRTYLIKIENKTAEIFFER